MMRTGDQILMDRIDSHIAFVKEQMVAQESLAKKYEATPYRAGRHLTAAQRCRILLDDLESLKKKTAEGADAASRAHNASRRVSLTLQDIEDLPEDLIKELNITETDRLELIIEDIISSAGGVQSLSKILVELYKRTGEVHKRTATVSRLFRMAQRSVIYNVPGKKGIYSTHPISEQDAKQMFGQIEPEPIDNT
jgi:hypothetical protein